MDKIIGGKKYEVKTGMYPDVPLANKDMFNHENRTVTLSCLFFSYSIVTNKI